MSLPQMAKPDKNEVYRVYTLKNAIELRIDGVYQMEVGSSEGTRLWARDRNGNAHYYFVKAGWLSLEIVYNGEPAHEYHD